MTDKQSTGPKEKNCSRSGCSRRYYAKQLCYLHYRREYYWKQKGEKNPRPNRPQRRKGVKGDVWLPGARVSAAVKMALVKEAVVLRMDLTPFIQRLLIALSESPATIQRLLPRDVASTPPLSYK